MLENQKNITEENVINGVTEDKKEKKKNTTKTVLIVIGILFASICCCCVGGTLFFAHSVKIGVAELETEFREGLDYTLDGYDSNEGIVEGSNADTLEEIEGMTKLRKNTVIASATTPREVKDRSTTECKFNLPLDFEDTIVEDESARFTITYQELVGDTKDKVGLAVELKNTSNMNIDFRLHALAVNDLETPTKCEVTVKAGDTVNEVIDLNWAYLQKWGVSDITSMDVALDVYQEETYYESLADTKASIYPYGMENERLYEFKPTSRDIPLMGYNDFQVTLLDADLALDNRYLDLYVEYYNKNEGNFCTPTIQINDAFLEECDAYCSEKVLPFHSQFVRLDITDEMLEYTDVTDIEELVIHFTGFDGKMIDRTEALLTLTK